MACRHNLKELKKILEQQEISGMEKEQWEEYKKDEYHRLLEFSELFG